MKISIHRNKLRFVLYTKLTCTWFKICILICCVYVIVRFLANVNSRSHSLYAVARPSVVGRLSVTFVQNTQAVVIFRNISTALGTLAI